MSEDVMVGFCFGMVLGILLMGGILIIIDIGNITISQETGDDICRNLTGNETVVASWETGGKLKCSLPSFDATQNIIIEKNNE